MTTTKTFIFALAQFTQAGKDLLLYAQRHPALFALCSLTIAAGIVTIIVPLAIGFSSAGPITGTVAAAWQASIGNVVAGSLFATLQSMTMTKTLVAVGGGLIAVGVGGLVGGNEWAKGVEWAKNVDWTRGENWAEWMRVARLDNALVEQWGKRVEWAGKAGWKRAEDGVRSVDWQGAGNCLKRKLSRL